MLNKDQVHQIREYIAPHIAPVLSLYVDVNPANPENARGGWLVRVKNALHDIDMPARLRDQVIAELEEERPPARTLVLFAAEDFLRPYYLQVDLPVVDMAHGRVEARWGQPYITPLLYAVDEYERAGVLWLAPERWRFYEVFLGEIEEATETFRNVSAEEWRELKKYDPVAHAGLYRARMGTDREDYKSRVAAWEHRTFKRLAHLLEHVVDERGIQRLVLLGPEPRTASFERHLSRSLRKRVVARVSNVPDEDDVSPAMILEKVAPVLEEAERAYEARLLDQIREQPGVWGLGQTLDTLQYGQVAVLVAPWSLQAKIWRCPSGWVGETPEAAIQLCPGEQPQEVALRDVIDDLAVDFGTGLEFVRGRPEQILLDEFGGLAGLLRW